MRAVLILTLMLAYLTAVYINAGFMLADLQKTHNYDAVFNHRWYRSDLGFAVGLSLLPPVWFMTPFMTGFYEHGWMRPSLEVHD